MYIKKCNVSYSPFIGPFIYVVKKSIEIGKRSPSGFKSILADQKTRLLQNILNNWSLNYLNKFIHTDRTNLLVCISYKNKVYCSTISHWHKWIFVWARTWLTKINAPYGSILNSRTSKYITLSIIIILIKKY